MPIWNTCLKSEQEVNGKMENWRRICLLLVTAIFLVSACGKTTKERVTKMAESPDGNLQVGQTAPDFEALATNDKNIGLSDLKNSWVVLFFYPKAFTSG